MASTPSSGEISIDTLRQVFGPARHPGTVDYYGTYYPGAPRFPGPPGDIDSYRNADNDEIKGTTNMPSPGAGTELEIADFYGKKCPVYGAYITQSIYEYPPYSYHDKDGNSISEPSEEVTLQGDVDAPDPKSYDNYEKVTINVEGDVYTTTPTDTKVDWNYGYYAWFDNETQEYKNGPFTNEGDFNERVYGDLSITFTRDYEPFQPNGSNGLFPYKKADGSINYFETNQIYSYKGIIGTTEEWQFEGTHDVSARLVRHVYGVKRTN